ncbi:hypothetical protein A2W32_02865 [candidate division WWE3 bacterium RBG_16_37_10]|uniref:Uncharacterized protein n=1 Tax=candidate division WWE3 bacterium RBG_16_37_10 TaxID=1802610 RepID=A0A1F4UXS2_UNCKA|nr:MAG: hypothetical protein A2W32_02865 [candidate division WWE3 bacterium RBG_16_37_10]
MFKKFLQKLIPYSLIIFIAIAIYSNTLSAEFVFDDYKTVLNNQLIKNTANLQDLWKNNPRRFVSYLSFAVNYQMGKQEVFWYHTTNIAIHLLTGVSFFIFLKLLIKTPLLEEKFKTYKKLPFLAALIFLVHPIQTQAVTYITQRMASLAGLFYIAALIFYLKANLVKQNVSSRGGKFASGAKFWILISFSLMFSLLAFLTKENTYTLPITMLLIQYLFFAPSIKNFIKKTLPAVPALLLAFFIAIASYTQWIQLGNLNWKTLFSVQTLRGSFGILNGFSWTYLLTQFKVIIYYIKLLFLPISQNLDYDFPVSKSIFEPATFASLIAILAIIFMGILLHKKYRIISFGILFFFLALSIESSIFPLNDVIYEHRLYLPSAGAIIAVVCIFCELQHAIRKNIRFTETRKISLARVSRLLIFSTILLLSIATVSRNKAWQTQVSIWTDTITKSPNKARPYNGLGIALFGKGQYGLAAKSFQKAIEIKPQSEEYTNLGKTLIKLGKHDEAAEKFEKAIVLDPDNIDAANSLKNLHNKSATH